MGNITAHKSTLNIGSVGGGILSDTYVQNGNYFNIVETTGSPATEIEFEFTITGTATTFKVYGRYEGNAGHNVNVDAWNGSTWDTLGTWPHSVSDALTSWNLQAGHTISGNVKVRVQHTSPGNINHDFWFDYVYITNGSPERMILSDGSNVINFSPLVTPAYNRPDDRTRGRFEASDKTMQLWDTGGGHKGILTLNDVPKSQADCINDWWRSLDVLTYTPNTDEAGTTLPVRISPAGQKPMQMWFDTGHKSRYAGAMTLSEISSWVYADLNGSSQYFYRSDADFPESGITGANDLTLQAWIKPGDITGDFTIASKWLGAGNKRMYHFWQHDDELRFSASDDGGAGAPFRTTTNANLIVDEWTHVAITYDASAGSCIFYKNGIVLSGGGAGLDTSIADKDPDFIIGWDSSTLYFDGGIFNAALFDDIRTPTEILFDYDHPFSSLAGEGNLIGQWMINDKADATFIDNSQGDSGRDLIPYNGGNTTFENCGRALFPLSELN